MNTLYYYETDELFIEIDENGNYINHWKVSTLDDRYYFTPAA